MTKNGDFHRFQGTAGYIASGPLVDAVNCAIALGRPLLLKGEPGTGKTVLAQHVAEGLGMPIIQWHIKSTTKGADGLYLYDTVQRLNDSRFGGGDVADIRHYIKLGPLGRSCFRHEPRYPYWRTGQNRGRRSQSPCFPFGISHPTSFAP